MKKMILLLLLAGIVYADGPLFRFKDTETDQEFRNAYQSIRNPSIESGTAKILNITTSTVQSLSVSTITVTSSATVKNLILSSNANANSFKIVNLANGTASTDAVALGQLTGVRVLQVVTCSATQSDSTTSTSFTDTSTTCSITPTNATTKMFIYAWALTADTRGDLASGFFTITGTANGNRCDASVGCASINPSVAGNGLDHIFFGTVDNPGTATAQTYKVQYKSGSASATIRWGTGATAWLQIIEIG